MTCRELLEKVPHAYKCSTYDDEGRCDCHRVDINAFLAQGCDAEKLREALERERDHWRAALVAFEGNDTVDIDYESALRAESNLTRLLSSPAQGEHVHTWVDARNEVIKSGAICADCGAIWPDQNGKED